MLVLVLVLASLRRTCKPGRRKHKHKRKEIKLKNSDKFSAYILVTHVLPFAKWRQQILMLLRLRMLPYACAYRTCKHACACAYAYACVIRVNQALVVKGCLSGMRDATILTVKRLRIAKEKYANQHGTPSHISKSYFLLPFEILYDLADLLERLLTLTTWGFSHQNKKVRRQSTLAKCSLGYSVTFELQRA